VRNNRVVKIEVKTNNIVYICRNHIVFCPKCRCRALVDWIDERLTTIIMETGGAMRQELIEKAVLPGHVHLLVGCNTRSDIHRLVKYIKGTSSRLPSLWMNTYFVAMVGGRHTRSAQTLRRESKG